MMVLPRRFSVEFHSPSLTVSKAFVTWTRPRLRGSAKGSSQPLRVTMLLLFSLVNSAT